MVYTSLSSKDGIYPYQLNIAHLYGNLMNTYGDNGNILMLKYVAEKLGAHVTVDIVSLHDNFDEHHYDIAFFGGGQDFEQSIIAGDLPAKKESIDNFIQNDGVVLAICGGFQLLGQYYIEASGRRIEGLGVMGHYTLNQTNNRFIGDKECTLVLIKNPVGATQAIEMIKLAPYPFSLSVLLNANYADGIDTSWIWDAEFEQITDMDIPEINAGGVRHSEIARRLRVTGYPADKITETSRLEQVLKTIEAQDCKHAYILATYTAMLEFRELLANRQIVRKEMN